MSSAQQLLDAAGRRRSPATMPEFHAGKAPGNKGQRYAADPPTVDEIIAVMRHARQVRYGNRLNGLIVVRWRAGLRINEALSLTETDLDERRGSILRGVSSAFRQCFVAYFDLGAEMNVLTRSYANGRAGANTQETTLTPALVGSNLLVKQFSLDLTNDDPRIEAQPLFVSGVQVGGQARDIVYVCTMANNVWAFDADTGQAVWPKPVNLAPPLLPAPFDIQLFDINIHWGILSTPVIDLDTNTIYIVCWTSQDGSVANAQFQLHALDITTGEQRQQPITITANGAAQGAPNVLLVPSRNKQPSRPSANDNSRCGWCGTQDALRRFFGHA